MTAKKRQPNGQCMVCNHAELYRIELALRKGVSCAAVGKKYGISKSAAWRHWNNHVSDERKNQLAAGPLSINELAERAADQNMSVMDYLDITKTRLMTSFLAADECADRRGAALISGRLLEALRLQAQLTGEITKATSNYQTNVLIMNSPLMAELQSMLIRELSPFPEARTRVVAGLEELSKRALPSTPPNGSGTPVIEGQYASR